MQEMESSRDAEPASYEAMREQYGPHERRVRSVALLYWLIASQVVLSAITTPYLLWTMGPPEERNAPFLVAGTLMLLCMAALFAAAAWQLQRLSNTGQILGIITACGALLLFPIGTIAGAMVLWTLLGTQGKTVFSQTYRDAVAATPNLQFRVSKVAVWLVVAFIVLMTVSALLILGLPAAMGVDGRR